MAVQDWRRMTDEEVRFMHAYWKEKGRGEVTLLEAYSCPTRKTRCPFAGSARNAFERMERMGLAKRLPAFSVAYRGKPRKEAWLLT